MAAVFTDTGLALMAAADLPGGEDVIITEVRVGTLNAGQRYEAAADRTALVDATPTVLSGDNINLTGSGPNVNYNVSVDSQPRLVGSEVGLFTASGDMVILWAEQSRDVFVKAADARALIAILYSYVNGVASGLSISLSAFAFASLAQARAATDNDVAMTPLRTQDWWNALTVVIGKLRNLIATNAQARTGTSDDVLMTPQKTQFWWTNLAFPFSKLSGHVATMAQAVAGATALKLLTPLGLTQWWNALATVPVAKMPSGIRRMITATVFDTAFPTSPATGQNVYFTEAVQSGLAWRDTDGTTPLTSAAAGDWAMYTGVRWQKQARRTGDVFLIPE